MARTWLQIKVELVGGLGGEFEPPPGRVFAVSPSLTFERFADAINRAFGRWDFSHLHAFELGDGGRIGFVDDAIQGVPTNGNINSVALNLACQRGGDRLGERDDGSGNPDRVVHRRRPGRVR